MMMKCDEFEVGRGERPSSSSGGTQKVAALSLSFSVFFFSVVKRGVRVLLFRRESNKKRSTRQSERRVKSLSLSCLFLRFFFPIIGIFYSSSGFPIFFSSVRESFFNKIVKIFPFNFNILFRKICVFKKLFKIYF